MISSLISRASATLLLLGGLALVFAPDVLLPALVPGFPATGAWLGQVLGAAWLGLAGLNWLSRSTLLGGIYGRPVVYTNLVTHVTGALALLRVCLAPGAPPLLWYVAAPSLALAAAYAALMFRGPFDPLQAP